MLLSRKIDDVVRFDQTSGIINKHPAWLDQFLHAGTLVCPKIIRPFVLELKCDPFTHHANAIHRIYNRVDVLA
jgi:hypothetical protein